MTAVSSTNSFATPTTPAATTPSTAGSAGGVITDSNSLSATYNQFLTLLTTQLKNQDPTSPMDTSQFTSQLVSFSQVEQQLKTNDSLTKLVTLANNNQTQLGLSYMGLNVSVDGSKFDYNPSTDASVTVGYNLASNASSNTINVLDSKGNVVYTTQGNLSSGANSFTWNGTESNGQTAPAGTYTVQVNAADATNTPISATTQVPGTVTGMQTASDGTIDLVVGSQVVPLSSVTSAFLPARASSASNTAGTGTTTGG